MRPVERPDDTSVCFLKSLAKSELISVWALPLEQYDLPIPRTGQEPHIVLAELHLHHRQVLEALQLTGRHGRLLLAGVVLILDDLPNDDV